MGIIERVSGARESAARKGTSRASYSCVDQASKLRGLMAQVWLTGHCALFTWADWSVQELVMRRIGLKNCPYCGKDECCSCPDQKRGTMRSVASSSSKWCDAIPACDVTTVHFFCRRSLNPLRRSPSKMQPMTNNGSVRHDKALAKFSVRHG